MLDKLTYVYGSVKGELLYQQIDHRIRSFLKLHPLDKRPCMCEKDAILITYGDQFKESDEHPLRTLHLFMQKYFKDSIASVHILPFYPYSSDDGFSVINYRQVNPELGNWADIEALSGDYQLMFDAVINHISAKSDWFTSYLKGDPKYSGYFIEADPEADYSLVTRPRLHPLLTSFETNTGIKHIWTTFSADQIDLNYASTDLFLEIVDLMLFYIAKGAKLIRLDAIGYLWKKLGTACIHLPQTHALVQIIREILDRAAPGTILITETNVPHQDNISYFGDGYNEAQMVYQFPLPPLTLHAIYTGSSRYLSGWAKSLAPPSEETTFFNFLASHDGIGVMPARGILPETEVQRIVSEVEQRHGLVSYKDNGNGSKSPYELNITWFSAMVDPGEPVEMSIRRFIASQAILLSLQGVPGIYIHSLLGSTNDITGMESTGQPRRINRQKFALRDVERLLSDEGSVTSRILAEYTRLLKVRGEESSFHPNAPQRVVDLNEALFSLVRGDVLCIINVSAEVCDTTVHLRELEMDEHAAYNDLVSDKEAENVRGSLGLVIEPYQVMWLKQS